MRLVLLVCHFTDEETEAREGLSDPRSPQVEPRHRPASHPRELLAELVLTEVLEMHAPPALGDPPKKRRYE